MWGRLAIRLVSILFLALVGAFLIFVMGYYGPDDPVRTILGTTWATPAEYEQLRRNLGLDRPLLVQFGDYIWNALHGDLGTSWQRGQPVAQLIGRSLGPTLSLIGAALVVMAVVGIPLGILAARKHNTFVDRLIVISAIIAHAIPPYVLAPILMVVFVLQLKIMSVPIGWNGLFSWTNVIPVLTLVAVQIVFIIRQTRSSVLEVRGEDYVRTARAMGLRPGVMMRGYILPNAAGPIVNDMGLAFGGLLVGTVFVETIFNIPGFGSLLMGSVSGQDYPLLVGSTIVAIVLISLAYLAADLVNALIDRRIRIA